VIVDICRKHGIWFDAHEFSQLLGWIRSGGLQAARRDMARLRGGLTPDHRPLSAEAGRESKSVSTTPVPGSPPPPEDPLEAIAEAAFSLIARLFRGR
jgi:hypothetical protein